MIEEDTPPRPHHEDEHMLALRQRQDLLIIPSSKSQFYDKYRFKSVRYRGTSGGRRTVYYSHGSSEVLQLSSIVQYVIADKLLMPLKLKASIKDQQVLKSSI